MPSKKQQSPDKNQKNKAISKEQSELEKTLKSTFNLEVSFNAVDGTPSIIYLHFT